MNKVNRMYKQESIGMDRTKQQHMAMPSIDPISDDIHRDTKPVLCQLDTIKSYAESELFFGGVAKSSTQQQTTKLPSQQQQHHPVDLLLWVNHLVTFLV